MARQRRPSSERRRQIADAALRIIGERGVKSLTAAELGRAVGIADATLFRHFKNKHEIVLAAIDRLEEIIFEGFPPTGREPLERLRALFLSRLELVATRPELLQLALTERLLEVAGQEGLEKLISMAERSRAFVVECLEEARERGLIGTHFSPALVSHVVLGTMHTSAIAMACPAGKVERTEPESIWRTVEELLRASATAAARSTSERASGG